MTPYLILKSVALKLWLISPTTCFTDEELALHFSKNYLEEGEDRDEMEAFIEDFRSQKFLLRLWWLWEMVKQYDQETVDAFLGADFDIRRHSRLEDAYYG